MLGIYLMFNGNCAEALKTYEKAFGARVTELQKYGDMPADPNFPIAESQKERILHARITLGGIELMCADAGEGCASGDNMYVSVTTKDEGIVHRAWDALSPDGQVFMALAPSFFAKLHGSLKDRFGVNWMFTALK